MAKSVRLLLSGVAIVVGIVAYLWRDTFEPESLSGARVLVTGASDGIGEQMAYHYARFGAQIVLTARREAVLQKVMEKCLELGAKKVAYFPADMASPSEPEKLVQFALKELGGLDYVVLNHIGTNPLQMWNGELDHLRWLMEVNFMSYVAIATAALPALTESKGALVVVSSFAGKVGLPMSSSYSSTKFALNGFFGALRNELVMQRKDVSMTICYLGLIDTETAMIKARKVTSMPAAPASEAALVIVKGGATRALEIFYPWIIQVPYLITDPFPQLRDMILRYFYTYTSDQTVQT